MTADLVELARDGDADAFEDLLSRRVDRLYTTASLILHDRTLAEDAVQEAMVRAWRSLPSLRDPERFDAWVHRLLVHACIDAARGARRGRSEQELPDALASNEDLEAAVADRDALQRAFARLSANHRAAFVLRHHLGNSMQEMADALRVPIGTAKSRLYYAEQAMAAAMEADSRWATEGEAL
jgi:RNA polymerase sigma-70 factor, ECF subfamily